LSDEISQIDLNYSNASSQESVGVATTDEEILLGESKKKPARRRKTTKILKKAMRKMSQTKGRSNFLKYILHL